MNNVNNTLYIPLYGKAYVSEKGVILEDKMAEKIWKKEGFELKGKSKSKWLAYYMGMRSCIFDSWLVERMKKDETAVVLHIGCGMDSRISRIGAKEHLWYDIDFPEVIEERKKYYEETDTYHMLGTDVRRVGWMSQLPTDKKAIVVMEGVSMYLEPNELKMVLNNLRQHFNEIELLLDCYTTFAAKASKYKNPINDVGVTTVYGMDGPKELEGALEFVKEHDMTPDHLIAQLEGIEKIIFKKLFAGDMAKKMYRMYEYKEK